MKRFVAQILALLLRHLMPGHLQHLPASAAVHLRGVADVEPSVFVFDASVKLVPNSSYREPGALTAPVVAQGRGELR